MNELFQSELNAVEASGRLRALTPQTGNDLSSNDYLGFATEHKLQQRFHDRLADFPVGASGSRLLRGNLLLHAETEALLADFVDQEDALLFPSGYQANVALLSTLLNEDTLVFSDALNHASIIDGIRLSRSKKIIYSHRNLQSLEDALKSQAKNNINKIIVTESLFSMEGTLAPLGDIVEIGSRYGAKIIVDEAHSTGIWGASLVAKLGLAPQVLATVHPAGKAMGVGGAWIAGSKLLKEYLINFARPFIFTTAIIPAMALFLQEAVRFYQEEGQSRADKVLSRAKYIQEKLPPLLSADIRGPILPILVGDNVLALQLAKKLQQRGWDVRAIRPPTVPEGTARLRVTVKWHNSEEQLLQFAKDLSELWNDSELPSLLAGEG